MLKIFGKNNNQVFRQSQKQTYSMPQTLHLDQPITKCACGFDYIAILASTGKLYFLFQAKFYLCENVPLLVDVASSENTVIMLTRDREILAWDFDQEKIGNGRINFSKIRMGLDREDSIVKVQMGFGDIFLISENGKVYHFKRNQWYQTKSYSNIQSIELSNKVIDVSSGPNLNLFLSYEGSLYKSSKQDPLHIIHVQTPHKFIKIASSNYHAGVTKKGTIMIWGDSIHGNFRQPTEFSKLTKKFVDVKLDRENGYALADDGEVWVWGRNSCGELGLSDYETRIKPFPLITLEKNHVFEIFSAHSYACCLCETEEKAEKNTMKVIDRKVTEFCTVRDQAKITRKPKKNSNPPNPIYIQQGHYEVKSKCAAETSLQNRRKISNKSIDKKSHKKSPSATPSQSQSQSPSPSPAHKKKPSTKTDKKSQIKQKSSLKQNRPSNHWLISQRQNEQQSRIEQQQQTKNLQIQILQLKQQNYRLQEKVHEQADIIHDITNKIRMLEEAIDQHERSLTSRDHILQEYQSKEQVYISHINQLQKTIDEIVRYKEKNNQVMVVYEDLKTNFEKQRSYYIDKIKEYQIKIHVQEDTFKKQVQDLKKKLAAKQAANKENSRAWQSHSPIQKKPEMPYFRGEMIGQRKNTNSMDHVIDQIEENRSRITKSANKLIAMLDISQ